jgi:hypothetical protein
MVLKALQKGDILTGTPKAPAKSYLIRKVITKLIHISGLYGILEMHALVLSYIKTANRKRVLGLRYNIYFKLLGNVESGDVGQRQRA